MKKKTKLYKIFKNKKNTMKIVTNLYKILNQTKNQFKSKKITSKVK